MTFRSIQNTHVLISINFGPSHYLYIKSLYKHFYNILGSVYSLKLFKVTIFLDLLRFWELRIPGSLQVVPCSWTRRVTLESKTFSTSVTVSKTVVVFITLFMGSKEKRGQWLEKSHER